MQPSEREGYQELFDMIRPQTGVEGPALWVLLGLVLVAVVLIGGTSFVRRRKRSRQLSSAFHALAVEKALTPAEEKRLLAMAESVTADQPLQIFSSLADFEAAVEALVPTDAGEPAPGDLLTQLRSLRVKLGFDRIPKRWRLRHSRQIPVGARLMVGFGSEEEGRMATCDVEGTNASFIRATPLLRRDQDLLSEVRLDTPLVVRYWRSGDTEYLFASRLLAGTEKDRSQLRLAHASRLERLQQRDFFRLKVKIPVTLYDLPDPDLAMISQEDFELPEESRPVLEGTIMDISAGGCAVRSDEQLPADSLVVVDPDVEGPFSIGRMICRVGHLELEEGALLHRLEYVNAPPAVQDRLMRELYQEQQERAGE